jgi:hypothetical protein
VRVLAFEFAVVAEAQLGVALNQLDGFLAEEGGEAHLGFIRRPFGRLVGRAFRGKPTVDARSVSQGAAVWQQISSADTAESDSDLIVRVRRFTAEARRTQGSRREFDSTLRVLRASAVSATPAALK